MKFMLWAWHYMAGVRSGISSILVWRGGSADCVFNVVAVRWWHSVPVMTLYQIVIYLRQNPMKNVVSYDEDMLMKNVCRHALVLGLGVVSGIFLIGCAQSIDVESVQTKSDSMNQQPAYPLGTPTVVFEHGADNEGKRTWRDMIHQVSSFAPTIAFSRTGWGEQVFGNVPNARTPSIAATDLREKLQQKGIKPPYILVAHSVGSYYVLNFARQWPNEVAAIVLVDGRLKTFTALCKQYEGNLCDPAENTLLLALMPEAGRAEIMGEKKGRDEIPEPESLGNIPVTLFYNTKQEFPHNKGFTRAWIESQDDFAKRLAKGKSLPVEGGHFIHHTYPDLVRDAIKFYAKQNTQNDK